MHTQRSLYNSKLCLIFLLIRPLDGTSVTFTQSKINEGLMSNDPLYCINKILRGIAYSKFRTSTRLRHLLTKALLVVPTDGRLLQKINPNLTF